MRGAMFTLIAPLVGLATATVLVIPALHAYRARRTRDQCGDGGAPQEPAEDALTLAASVAGLPYGMTASQTLQYIAIGERLHGDARTGECGAVDPRDESQWCREPEGHQGEHSPVASPADQCGVLRRAPHPYEYCDRPIGCSGPHRWCNRGEFDE